MEGLTRSLEAGQAVLTCGGSAVDAVVAAVMQLEADPHFNAGEGNEHDRSNSKKDYQ
jgi:beta-aspartyl-peptidase (threonine type)